MACAILVVAALVLPWSYQRAGMDGIFAACLAGVLCWLCGAISLWIVYVMHHPEQMLKQVLFTMLVRMGIPLTACLVLFVVRGPLYDAGMLFYLLAFYAVTLLLDTYFATQNRSLRSAATKVT